MTPLDQQVGVELEPILESIVLFLALPFGLATLTRAGIERTDVRLDDVMRRIRLPYLKTLVLAVIIISMFAVNADEIFDNPSVVLRLLAPISAFFAIAFVLLVMVGRAMGFPYEQTVALVFTTNLEKFGGVACDCGNSVCQSVRCAHCGDGTRDRASAARPDGPSAANPQAAGVGKVAGYVKGR